MNALAFPFPRLAGTADAAVWADMKIAAAMDRVADSVAEIYQPRLALTDGQATAASELRRVLADLAAARSLLAPLMTERV